MRLSRLAIALAAGALLALAPTAAFADGPMRLDTQLTDEADVLGSRQGEAQAALDELRSRTGLQLFVVFVHSFDGDPAQEWTDETATRSDLGDRDGLLAVATRDRSYAYSFDQAFPLTDAQLADVARVAIEPALAQNDWAGAVVGASDGYAAALAGQPIPPPRVTPGQPDTSSGGGVNGALVGGLVAAGAVGAAGVGGYAYYRSRRRKAAAGAQQPQGPTGPSTEELSARANSLLISLDDELRGSAQELDIAKAQYGEEATTAFTAALESARQEVAEAFRLRMSLESPEPGTPPLDEAGRRAALTEIIRRCEEADQRLDAEADAFDRLREIEPRVEQVAAALEARRAATAERVSGVMSTLDALKGRYAGEALAAVANNPTQARERLEFAATALARAGEAVGAGDRSQAALAVRAAEEALGQTDTLLAAVGQVGTDLDAARAAVDALLVEVEAEVAQGRAAGEGAGAELAAAVAGGADAAAGVRAGLTAPTTDPQAALRRLREADAALDRALATFREAADRTARARSLLDQALPVARAEVAAASDFVTTRRGAVGGQARTWLAEAQRQLARAEAFAATDPVSALAAAQEAHRLAASAGQSARTDVDGWAPTGSWGRGGGAGDVVLGAILGGILSGGGGGGRSRGGGWGGGGGGGGWSGGFGGSGARSRRGGGGRF